MLTGKRQRKFCRKGETVEAERKDGPIQSVIVDRGCMYGIYYMEVFGFLYKYGV